MGYLKDWTGVVLHPLETFEGLKNEATIGSASIQYFVFILPLVAVMFSILFLSMDVAGLFGLTAWLALAFILIALAGFIGFGIIGMFETQDNLGRRAIGVGVMASVYAIAGILFVMMPSLFGARTEALGYFVALLFKLVLFIAVSNAIFFAVAKFFGGTGSFEQHFYGQGLLAVTFTAFGTVIIIPAFAFLYLQYSPGLEGLASFDLSNLSYAAIFGYEFLVGISLFLSGSFLASNLIGEPLKLLQEMLAQGALAMSVIAVAAAVVFSVLAARSAFGFFKSVHGFNARTSFVIIGISILLCALIWRALLFLTIIKPA